MKTLIIVIAILTWYAMNHQAQQPTAKAHRGSRMNLRNTIIHWMIFLCSAAYIAATGLSKHEWRETPLCDFLVGLYRF